MCTQVSMYVCVNTRMYEYTLYKREIKAMYNQIRVNSTGEQLCNIPNTISKFH